jgi:hypothetical protein
MSDPEADRRSFVRGMTIGAIIGAIVAGSSLWTRRQSRRRAEPKPVELPATTEPVAVSDEGPAR